MFWMNALLIPLVCQFSLTPFKVFSTTSFLRVLHVPSTFLLPFALISTPSPHFHFPFFSPLSALFFFLLLHPDLSTRLAPFPLLHLLPISAPSSLLSLFFLTTIPVPLKWMSNPVPILILEPLSGMISNRQGWGAHTHTCTHTYTCWVCRQQLFDFAQLLHRISHRESGATHRQNKEDSFSTFSRSYPTVRERKYCNRSLSLQRRGGWNKRDWDLKKGTFPPHHFIKGLPKLH